jgi:MEKHLA domain
MMRSVVERQQLTQIFPAANLQNTLPRRAEKFTIGGVNEIWQGESAVAHAQLLARSFKHFTQRDLFAENVPAAEFAAKIFHAPFVLVSHGTEADPVLNYGNQAALSLWEMSWAELTRTPSRLTAEAPNREERARLLAAVTARGFIDDYSGVRISKTGRRFQISRATVWNLISPDGKYCGQAAMFREWKFL